MEKLFTMLNSFLIFEKVFSKSGQGCKRPAFGHRLIYICGEAATTTLNPEPMEPAEFLMPCIHGRGEPAAFISV